jgi:hypothetical protein
MQKTLWQQPRGSRRGGPTVRNRQCPDQRLKAEGRTHCLAARSNDAKQGAHADRRREAGGQRDMPRPDLRHEAEAATGGENGLGRAARNLVKLAGGAETR